MLDGEVTALTVPASVGTPVLAFAARLLEPWGSSRRRMGEAMLSTSTCS
jgi:hypothetical protein